ncbi:hypothetical protein SAMN06264365_107245 [Actinoplanes regularis]|uniref:Uncharacterized protein n=1 Tax=Actinoplanes regularis TaxID=52697 RepID=A0A239ADG8_9ACTN|nr:hypothetical protein SAMN06264365_107245 [Actinoplanes regularis]
MTHRRASRAEAPPAPPAPRPRFGKGGHCLVSRFRVWRGRSAIRRPGPGPGSGRVGTTWCPGFGSGGAEAPSAPRPRFGTGGDYLVSRFRVWRGRSAISAPAPVRDGWGLPGVPVSGLEGPKRHQRPGPGSGRVGTTWCPGFGSGGAEAPPAPRPRFGKGGHCLVSRFRVWRGRSAIRRPGPGPGSGRVGTTWCPGFGSGGAEAPSGAPAPWITPGSWPVRRSDSPVDRRSA